MRLHTAKIQQHVPGKMLIYPVRYTAMYYHMYMLYKKNVRDCSDVSIWTVAGHQSLWAVGRLIYKRNMEKTCVK